MTTKRIVRTTTAPPINASAIITGRAEVLEVDTAATSVRGASAVAAATRCSASARIQIGHWLLRRVMASRSTAGSDGTAAPAPKAGGDPRSRSWRASQYIVAADAAPSPAESPNNGHSGHKIRASATLAAPRNASAVVPPPAAPHAASRGSERSENADGRSLRVTIPANAAPENAPIPPATTAPLRNISRRIRSVGGEMLESDT